MLPVPVIHEDAERTFRIRMRDRSGRGLWRNTGIGRKNSPPQRRPAVPHSADDFSSTPTRVFRLPGSPTTEFGNCRSPSRRATGNCSQEIFLAAAVIIADILCCTHLCHWQVDPSWLTGVRQLDTGFCEVVPRLLRQAADPCVLEVNAYWSVGQPCQSEKHPLIFRVDPSPIGKLKNAAASLRFLGVFR